MAGYHKLRLAVFKFASCDGCQLSLLDCEDELLEVASAVDIANFAEASAAVGRGPYDVSLVEGSITTPHDEERLHQIRRNSRYLVAIGACATAGGIQALRNFGAVRDYVAAVYPNPRYIEALGKSTPIADHVFVDFELRGCPINKGQLVQALVALAGGHMPTTTPFAVCLECKRAGIVCQAVTAGAACLGPVTHAGCGALCPSFSRPCFGCFGPKESPNPASLAATWVEGGMAHADLVRAFRGFNAYAEPFRRESEAHEQHNH